MGMGMGMGMVNSNMMGNLRRRILIYEYTINGCRLGPYEMDEE